MSFFSRHPSKSAERFRFGEGVTYGERVEYEACSRLLEELTYGVESGMPIDEALDAMSPKRDLGWQGKGTVDLLQLPGLFEVFSRPSPLHSQLKFILAGLGACVFISLAIGVPIYLAEAFGSIGVPLVGRLMLEAVGAVAVLLLTAKWIAAFGGENEIVADLVAYLAGEIGRHRGKGRSLAESLSRVSPAALGVHRRIADALEAGDVARARSQARTAQPRAPIHERRFTAFSYVSYLAVLIGLFTFIMVKIMPKFTEIFYQLGAELPTVTRHLIDFSDWFIHGGMVLALLGALLFIGGQRRLPWYSYYLFFWIFVGQIATFVGPLLAKALEGESPEESISAMVGLVAVVLMFLALCVRGRIWKRSRLLGVLDPVNWAARIPLLRRSHVLRERVTFLSALEAFDPRRLPLAELPAAACGGALTPFTQARQERLERAVEQGRALAEILEDPSLHPLSERQGRLAALAVRAGTLPTAAGVLLDEALSDESAYNDARNIAMNYALLLSLGCLICFFALGLYLPLFSLPSAIRP